MLITRLKLDGNCITSIGGRRLGMALSKNHTLKQFSVGNMNIGK